MQHALLIRITLHVRGAEARVRRAHLLHQPARDDLRLELRQVCEEGFDDVRVEATRRYIEAYETITGESFVPDLEDPGPRLRRNLGLK